MLLIMRIAFHGDAKTFSQALSAFGPEEDRGTVDEKWAALGKMKGG